MKINSIPPSNLVENYKRTEKKQNPAQAPGSVADRVELSDDAQSFASVIQSVRKDLDVRSKEETERFGKIAAEIESGAYSVDSAKIAEKILGGAIDIEA